MTLWYRATGTGWADQRINLDAEPCPTIMAGGVHGGNCSQYWLEEDGVPSNETQGGKPPYRVPSMAEICAILPNGFTVASTFAGCGGSSTGYRMAGFKVLYANEFVEAARESYAANKAAHTVLDARDIRDVEASEVLAATGLAAGQLDVLDGSPPCASFSTAGRRQETWAKVRKYSSTSQRVDDLFFEFARILEGVKPRVFVAENVSGLVKGVSKGVFLEVLAALKGAGYRVAAKALDAQWLGVPQVRVRVIFVGVRADLGLAPVHPRPLPYRYSVREALPHLDHAKHDTRGKFRASTFVDAPCPTITIGEKGADSSHYKVRERIMAIGGNGGFSESESWQSPDRPAHTIGVSPVCGNSDGASGHILVQQVTQQQDEADISGYAIGAEADKLCEGEQSSRYFSLVRADQDEPCPTITASGGNLSAAAVVHPTERRKFTIAELKRICGFPDDFVLTGTYAEQWERLGRAVPPPMMRAVAEAIRDRILIPLRDGDVRPARQL